MEFKGECKILEEVGRDKTRGRVSEGKAINIGILDIDSIHQLTVLFNCINLEEVEQGLSSLPHVRVNLNNISNTFIVLLSI
jgi:hypothetical protein